MFGKKPPDQSQSFNNVTLTGGMVQAGQAGGDLQQSQSGQLETQPQISGTEVVRLLETLEAAVKAGEIADPQKEELLDYLRPAKREAAKETADKQVVGQNLKQVGETLKTLNDGTEAGKGLWKTGQEVFTAIAPWLGVAAKLIGL
jgi:hypothetical protein